MKEVNRNQQVVRFEQQLRQLGDRTPKCVVCGESNPFTLTGIHPNILCYQCLTQQTGKSPIEDHHIAGQHNDPFTVPIPGNDHRILNDMQKDWPESTLRNPDGSPLLRAAATLRGWLDVLYLIIDLAIGWIPPFLEWVDGKLVNLVSPQWWKDWGWEGNML